MITTADAMQVMLVVQACHRRTAPRMDDREATIATAAIWAELFNTYRLGLPDLIDAVKRRATTHPDAPEPAEIITVAREIRRTRDALTGPTPAYQAICDSKAAADERPEVTAARRRAIAAFASNVGRHRTPTAHSQDRIRELVDRQRSAAPPQAMDDLLARVNATETVARAVRYAATIDGRPYAGVTEREGDHR